MRTNVPASTPKVFTHEGGRAARLKPNVELERAVLACMLFENTFYEKGNDIAERIRDLVVNHVDASVTYGLAVRARNDYGLRHVPLWLLVCAAERAPRAGLARAIENTIQRPDELGELLALYWKAGRKPIPKQMKAGLARSFTKFSEHQLAKWNRDASIKLRDVMFMVHPKPIHEWQQRVWKDLAEGKLAAADTWEVALSGGADKKATWERLLDEKKLGIMALLMNLRNMEQAQVDHVRVRRALRETPKTWAFPYRFLTAARYAPQYAQELSDGMVERAQELPKLAGETHVFVDVSGSMNERLSEKSESTRRDAANSVAVCAREACEYARIFTFSERVVEIPNLRGLQLAAASDKSQPFSSTYLRGALERVAAEIPKKPDRIIVITDEQSHDGIAESNATGRGYVVNVAPYKPGLPTTDRGWTRINGWSDRLIDWIAMDEGLREDL